MAANRPLSNESPGHRNWKTAVLDLNLAPMTGISQADSHRAPCGTAGSELSDDDGNARKPHGINFLATGNSPAEDASSGAAPAQVAGRT